MHDTSKNNATFYKRQKCLVGIKYVSYFNSDFFFQFILINNAHRKLEDLRHLNHEILPEALQYFAACIVHIPHLMKEFALKDMLQKEGHKDYFVDNVLNYFANTMDVYNLWRMKVLRNEDFL